MIKLDISADMIKLDISAWKYNNFLTKTTLYTATPSKVARKIIYGNPNEGSQKGMDNFQNEKDKSNNRGQYDRKIKFLSTRI
jgi:hypothetical protein